MKKTIAVLIALMLAVSCLSLTAFAQEENEMVPCGRESAGWLGFSQPVGMGR